MSIVERALSKLQNDLTRKHTAPQAASPLRAPAAISREELPGVQPLSREPPRRSIKINYEILRATEMVPPESQLQLVRDEFRRIKWPILDAAFGKTDKRLADGNLLLVTSAVPGEGKSFVSLNLAFSLALERDCSVLLVDADLAKAHLSRLLGLDNEAGVTDLLADEALKPSDLIVGTDLEGLRVLPAGRPNPHAPELLASRRMHYVMDWLRRDYANAIVLFDSSPLLATNEAQVLSRIVGHVLLVIQANKTPQAVVMDMLNLLDDKKPTSCVLNQVSALGAGYYGYYGHGERNGATAQKK
jgi:receptor protein-tyrosine kinase